MAGLNTFVDKYFSKSVVFYERHFGRKNSDEKIRTKKFGRKKIGGKARGQGTAAAEARHG